LRRPAVLFVTIVELSSNFMNRCYWVEKNTRKNNIIRRGPSSSPPVFQRPSSPAPILQACPAKIFLGGCAGKTHTELGSSSLVWP
jgi:hypothetical protein